MYRNTFRGGLANQLQACKKIDICEKKAALKRSPGADKRRAEQVGEGKTLTSSKRIRGVTQAKTDVP